MQAEAHDKLPVRGILEPFCINVCLVHVDQSTLLAFPIWMIWRGVEYIIATLCLTTENILRVNASQSAWQCTSPWRIGNILHLCFSGACGPVRITGSPKLNDMMRRRINYRNFVSHDGEYFTRQYKPNSMTQYQSVAYSTYVMEGNNRPVGPVNVISKKQQSISCNEKPEAQVHITSSWKGKHFNLQNWTKLQSSWTSKLKEINDQMKDTME